LLLKRNLWKTLLVLMGSVGVSTSLFAQNKIVLKEATVAVQEIVADKYEKYHVESVQVNKDSTEYVVELLKKTRTLKLVLSHDGVLISKTKGRIYSYDGTEKPRNDGTPHNEHDGHVH
jgi:hypothetical protein